MINRALTQLAGRLLCCLIVLGTADHAVGREDRSVPSPAEQKQLLIESFESVWSTLRDQYWDPSMSGRNWKAVHDRYLRKLRKARDANEGEELLDGMIHELPSSHLAIIPASMYSPDAMKSGAMPAVEKEHADTSSGSNDDEAGSTGLIVAVIDGSVLVESVENGSAATAAGIRPGWTIESVDGAATKDLFTKLRITQPDVKAALIEEFVQRWLSGRVGSSAHIVFKRGNGTITASDITRREPSGKLVQFGNLPPEHVSMEHRQLANGVGYIRLNLFLDPVTVMPELESALGDFRNAPGVVLDLRNNPGGLGLMAMGIAGWFVSQEGSHLGTMISRDSVMNFDINPRIQPYTGRLAIVVNRGSASTTEILAQGLQDLGRARIFGTRTAGAALPSDIIELPNGDRFEYPVANYVSLKGRVLEGNGVQPDVVVKPTMSALLAGCDLPLEAASAWSSGPQKQGSLTPQDTCCPGSGADCSEKK